MTDLFATDSSVLQLLVALGLGMVLGLRRELDAQSKPAHERSYMGVRTAIVLALLGALSTMFPALPYLPVVILAAVLVLVAIAYAHGSFALNKIGLTSELTTLAIVLVGMAVGTEQYTLAILLTITLAILKEFRAELHKFISTLSVAETRGALQLLIFSGAVLPFLPMEAVDPLGVVVPFNVWLLVIFICGINFIGYFLTKYWGARGGTILTSVLGAMASSTAVTVSLAEQSAKKRSRIGLLAAGILVAMAVMELRVMIEVLVAGGGHFPMTFLLVPAAMSLTSFGFGLREFNRVSDDNESSASVEIESPFELWPAIKFGLIFIAVLAAIALGQRWLGDAGVYVAALLSGLVDVDAVVLSSLEAVRQGELASSVGQMAVFIGLLVNTIVKLGYVGILGSKKLVRRLILPVAVVSVVGAAVFFVI